MTDKERLEEIIVHVKKIESIFYDKWQRQELTNLIESLYYAGHVDWLIEQAKEKIQLEERVKELEQEKAEKVEYWRKQHRKRCNELEDAYFRIQLIEIQNKRYKQALEEINKLGWDSESFGGGYNFEGEIHAQAIKISYEALDGSE